MPTSAPIGLGANVPGGSRSNRDSFPDRVQCARLLLEAGAEITQRSLAVLKAAQELGLE